MTKRIDAKGQETRYIYDTYGRLTEVQHWDGSPLVESTWSRVNYRYDTNQFAPGYSQNAWGRLTEVTFSMQHGIGRTFHYLYSYNQAGRVTLQRLADTDETMEAGYTWDNGGRMTQIQYPNSGPLYEMTFDAMGRTGG